jgi:hypothetical protein
MNFREQFDRQRRDTIIQARRRARVHPDSRARLEQIVDELERT